MQTAAPLPLTYQLSPSEILRVESLMTTPFHMLSALDKRARVILGSQRTKEVLSSVPWYGNKAKAAAAEGKEMDYWRSLWMSGVNFLHPARASSTPEAVADMQEPPPTSATPGADSKPIPAQGNSHTGPYLKIAPSHFGQQVSEESTQLIRDWQLGERSTPEYAQ